MYFHLSLFGNFLNCRERPPEEKLLPTMLSWGHTAKLAMRWVGAAGESQGDAQIAASSSCPVCIDQSWLRATFGMAHGKGWDLHT